MKNMLDCEVVLAQVGGMPELKYVDDGYCMEFSCIVIGSIIPTDDVYGWNAVMYFQEVGDKFFTITPQTKTGDAWCDGVVESYKDAVQQSIDGFVQRLTDRTKLDLATGKMLGVDTNEPAQDTNFLELAELLKSMPEYRSKDAMFSTIDFACAVVGGDVFLGDWSGWTATLCTEPTNDLDVSERLVIVPAVSTIHEGWCDKEVPKMHISLVEDSIVSFIERLSKIAGIEIDPYTPNVVPETEAFCTTCSRAHEPYEPHDPTSYYWKLAFKRKYGRFPTVDDAMSHCTENVRDLWVTIFEKRGLIAVEEDAS